MRSKLKKAVRIVLPLFIVVMAMAGLYLYASVSSAETPQAKGGVLNLSEWNRESAFEISGQWEFYWGKALSDAQLEAGGERFVLVEAPGEWNYYDTELGELPGFGLATYRIRITGAQPGQEYGLRVQNQASAYRLYADGELIGENGAFGDKADAPAANYRPQLGAFTAERDSFDIILQIGNNAYAGGGMWEPVIFGTYEQVSRFDGALSDVGMFSFGGLAFICLFFLIFFTAHRRERDMLTLAGIGLLVIFRLLIAEDMFAAYLFPTMPISGFGWIDYLTLIWIQFLLLYFVYSAYGKVVPKWQLLTLLSYCALVSLGVMVLPFEVITSAYIVLNIILLFVTAFVTAQLGRAAWRKQAGASTLLGAMAFILLFVLYDMFVGIWPAGYYLLTATSIDYLVLFIAHCTVVARRYKRAQKMDSFCKKVLREEYRHCVREAQRRLMYEISFSELSPLELGVILGAFYGLRRGEIVGLK